MTVALLNARMNKKMIYFILSLILVDLSLPGAQTFAEAPASPYGNGVVNAAGQWARAVGTEGARANRNTADQLFKQSLQHEAQGIATLNVGLLSQSLTEAKQGIKADDQARHFAQTALQALKSGNTAGNVDLSGKYATTEAEMRDLANNSSPYLPKVQSKSITTIQLLKLPTEHFQSMPPPTKWEMHWGKSPTA